MKVTRSMRPPSIPKERRPTLREASTEDLHFGEPPPIPYIITSISKGVYKMWEGSELVEGRRKSARISALKEVRRSNAFSKYSDNIVDEKDQNQTHVTARKAASTGKRGRKRKRLTDVVQSSQQGGEIQQHEDNSIRNCEAANLPPLQQLPGRHILEFILDTLQSLDPTYIFAQPVDLQKVRTYLKIIKQPMDFGTMRAKLQEGIYTSWEQFERDVLLVSGNAIYFNASSTVYHLKGQEIRAISLNLFHALKSDPERFPLNFSLESCLAKYYQSEARGLYRNCAKPGDVKRRKQTDSNPHVDQKKYHGLRDGRNLNLAGTQRRQTYCRPSNDNGSLFSTVYDAPKTLVHIDAGLGYQESLMQFVKDLGPTAKMVAKRKLENLIEAQNCQSQATPPIETQNYRAFTVSAPVVAGHPADVNTGQITQRQHNSLYNLPRDSNVPYFLGDASAQGYAPTRAGIFINEGSYKGKMNVGGRLGMESNLSDPKGKMVLPAATGKDTYKEALQEKMAIDINKSINIPGLTTGIGLGSSIEDRAHQNQNKVRLESHIRVVRDLSSPGISNNNIRFRTVDMLAKPNNLGNQLPHQQAQLTRTGSQSNQSRLLEIMSRSNTYLRPSSYLPSPAAKSLSSLSQASTSFNRFGTQLNGNYLANSAQAGQQLQLNNCAAHSSQTGELPQLNNCVSNSAPAGQPAQWNRPSTAQGVQDHGMFPKVKLGEDLAKGMFMRKERELAPSAQGMMNPPLYPARATATQLHRNEPTSESLLSLLVDSRQPNLALQL